MKTVRSFGAPSVQTDPTNGDIILTVYPGDLIPEATTGDWQAAIVIRVPAVEIAAFVTQVVNAGTNALSDVITNLVYGDCPTCKNFRLVEQEVKGRMMRVACPDCRPEGDVPSKPLPMVRKPGFRKDELV